MDVIYRFDSVTNHQLAGDIEPGGVCRGAELMI